MLNGTDTIFLSSKIGFTDSKLQSVTKTNECYITELPKTIDISLPKIEGI
jgi:hypothetical protein